MALAGGGEGEDGAHEGLAGEGEVGEADLECVGVCAVEGDIVACV